MTIHAFIFLAVPWLLHAKTPDQPFPRVFQPDETQHGFSEFETMPEIPPSTSEPSSRQESIPNVRPPNEPNEPPQGLFYRLDFAKGFEEEEGRRRGHFIVPIDPAREFTPETKPIFLVFRVHQHYGDYQVFGRLYPENVEGLNPLTVMDKDAIHLANEDDSGYLQFDPPEDQWPPGSYRVEIFVGFEASKFNMMGTMRFSVAPQPVTPLNP